MPKTTFGVIITLAFLFVSSGETQSQSVKPDERRFEVGGQFSVINLASRTAGTLPPINCIQAPCPSSLVLVFTENREAEPGFGGRFGYNFSSHVAFEAEGNFFPRERAFKGGRKIQALFGVKAGKRFDKVGLFAKARPGFIRYEKGDYRQTPGTACITVFPPPLGCFTPVARTNFAFDLGGVLELYPSGRAIIRFDVGDTIIRLSTRNIAAFPAGGGSPQSGVVVPVTGETTHNFQGSIGVGFRF